MTRCWAAPRIRFACMAFLVVAAWVWPVIAAAQAHASPPLLAQAAPLAGAPPQRIVSLLPALTEAVCVLGACDRLVGVDRYSNWPEQVRQLPQLGGGLDPNVEAIVALQPDLVLTAASSPAARRLPALGIPVLVLEPVTFADVQPMLLAVAHRLGLPAPQAQAVWHDIETQLAATAQQVPAHAQGLRVYYEVNPALFAAGRASFVGEVMHRLGLDNVVPSHLGAFPKLNPEFVVRANPALIVVAQRESAGLSHRPGWRRIDAVSKGHVCALSDEQSDVMVRPGPRMAEAADIVLACLHRMTLSLP